MRDDILRILNLSFRQNHSFGMMKVPMMLTSWHDLSSIKLLHPTDAGLNHNFVRNFKLPFWQNNDFGIMNLSIILTASHNFSSCGSHCELMRVSRSIVNGGYGAWAQWFMGPQIFFATKKNSWHNDHVHNFVCFMQIELMHHLANYSCRKSILSLWAQSFDKSHLSFFTKKYFV